MNYSKKAEEIRQAMKPVRIQAGKWLLLHLNRAWSKGEVAHIPAGTYWMTEPLSVPSGSFTTSGEGSTISFDPSVPFAFNVRSANTNEEFVRPTLHLCHVKFGFDN